MKIEYKDNTKVCMCSELSYGDVFKEDGNYYMVCNGTNSFNCVNIETGITAYFNRNTKVEIVQGKFIVE